MQRKLKIQSSMLWKLMHHVYMEYLSQSKYKVMQLELHSQIIRHQTRKIYSLNFKTTHLHTHTRTHTHERAHTLRLSLSLSYDWYFYLCCIFRHKSLLYNHKGMFHWIYYSFYYGSVDCRGSGSSLHKTGNKLWV